MIVCDDCRTEVGKPGLIRGFIADSTPLRAGNYEDRWFDTTRESPSGKYVICWNCVWKLGYMTLNHKEW